MRLEQKKQEDGRNLAVLAACYLGAMLLCSGYTSPLYPNYFGYDSAIFSLLGKGITEGRQLYTELFDHKGPVIFFLNALGYWLGGRTGIFLLQCVEGLISLVFLYNTAKLFRPDKGAFSLKECLILSGIAYTQFFYTFERGNLTEEHSHPEICGVLYLLVKYAVSAEEKPEHPPKSAFAYGLALAYLAMLRLNNAVTVCGGILFAAIYLLIRKRYGNLLWNLLFGLLGIAAMFLPFFAWFSLQGSLEEMIYATFLHNFRIMGNTGRLSLFQDVSTALLFAVLYLPGAICLGLWLARVGKARKIRPVDGLLAVVLLVNLVVLLAANRFPHYFAIFSPVYAVFLWAYFSFEKKRFLTALVAVCTLANLGLIVRYSGASVYHVYIAKSAGQRYEVVKSDFDRIPEAERDSVIGFEIGADDYLRGDITPCYRYYTLQGTWALTSPFIIPEFMDFVENEEPLWVLTRPQEKNTQLLGILSEKYTRQFENEYIVYYRLKD